MPALGQVLLDVPEGAQAQLPPDVGCILFFDHQQLSQSLNFIFHLCRRKNREQVLLKPTNLLLRIFRRSKTFQSAASPLTVQSVDGPSPPGLDLRLSISCRSPL